MPSFFESMKRLAQGKPIFTPEESTGVHKTDSNLDANGRDQAVEPADPQHAADTPSGQKILPTVMIEDVKCSMNGSRLVCYAFIRNSSPYVVSLDKITVLNQRREIDATLRAGEKREFMVYSGDAPGHQNYHDADLQFKDNIGDYFISHHDVFFDAQDDYYTIRRFQFSGLRDM